MRAIGLASLQLSVALVGGVSADRATTPDPAASQALFTCEDRVVTESVVDETRHRSAREMLKALGATHVIPLNTRGYNYDSERAPEVPPRQPAKPRPAPTGPAPKLRTPAPASAR